MKPRNTMNGGDKTSPPIRPVDKLEKTKIEEENETQRSGEGGRRKNGKRKILNASGGEVIKHGRKEYERARFIFYFLPSPYLSAP